MSVDLEKNRNEILSTYKDVLDSKSKTDWALFGYEGQTNVLKVISSGDGGLIELTDDLNSGKILYGFVSITDDKTKLTKYLLINWQGEGVPTLRKGTCANHIRDVIKVLTGAHLTINARTEDDIEPESVLEKISSVRFAVKENRASNDDDNQKGIIGTNYSRIIPSKEINSKDRDNFWKKEEEEERVRIRNELEKRKNEHLIQEQEQRQRELREHSKREQQLLEAKAEEKVEVAQQKEAVVKNVQVAMPSVVRSTTQAEEMRQQRNQEVRQLIGSSVDKAKAVFAQNTTAEQVLQKTTKTAPVKPARNSITRSSSSSNQRQSPDQQKHLKSQQSNEQSHEQKPIEQEPIAPSIHQKSPIPNDTQNNHVHNSQADAPPVSLDDSNEALAMSQLVHNSEDDDVDSYSTIKRSPYTKGINSNQSSQELQEKVEQSPAPIIQSGNGHLDTDDGGLPSAEEIMYQDVMQEEGLRARALFDYQADDESEITFDPGDVITHIDQIDEGWWQGLGPDGSYGLFPANYVELIQ